MNENEKIDIGLLKWEINIAEGFEISDMPYCNGLYIIGTGFTYSLNDDFSKDIEWVDVYYPLLLQRAIEGVNREGRYEVNQDCDHIAVSETFHNYKYFFFQDQTPDQAKESALKYIYEQEMK